MKTKVNVPISNQNIWASLLGIRAHEIKQIPTGIAGLIDMVKKTSSGLVSFHLVLISRRTRSSKLGFFRLRFQHSEGTKSQK